MPTTAKLFFGSSRLGGTTNAVFNEVASTGCTFYTLTNPDGDGKNYRYAQFLTSGTLVFESEGLFDTWLGGPGGRGGYTNQGGNLGAGGGCGGVLELHKIFGNAGSYTITVGTQSGTAAGTPTSIEGPLPAPWTKIICSPGNAGSNSPSTGNATTAGATGSITTTYTSYAGGAAGSGYGGGSAGTGAAGSGRFGGAAATYTGWAQSSFQFGKGGNSQYGPASGAANSGNGGDGSEYSSYGTGGSGRAYIRVEI